ncbi:MAG: hypothetical protein ACXWDJ_10585 [Aeromicrobium sp.]
MISLTIDRTALSLPDLVISNDPTDGLWLPEDGFGRPGKVWRRTSVSSPFIHGSVQTRAVLEQASIPVAVFAQGVTTAALRTLQAELEAALSQWIFEATVTEDGSATTFECDCADVSWNEFDSGMTRSHLARATVTIPCYPVGA